MTARLRRELREARQAAREMLPNLYDGDWEIQEEFKRKYPWLTELEESTDPPPTGWLDARDFYELCQQYRHAPLFPIDVVRDAYEALKAHIRRQIMARELEGERIQPGGRHVGAEEDARGGEEGRHVSSE